MRTSVKYTIGGASLVLVIISLISKGLGFFREIVYAGTFGLSREFDLYLVSAAIPITINTAVLYTAQHYFVPGYHRIKNLSPSEADKFLNQAFYLFVTASIIISVFLAMLSKPLMGFFISGIDAGTFELANELFLLFLITLPFNAGVAILSAYLQSEYKFILPAAAQLFMNIIVIVMVLFFSGWISIYVLPLSFIAGNIAALIILTARVSPVLKMPSTGSMKGFNVSGSDFLIILVIIELISLSYPVIDRYFYGTIPDGGIAALNYAMTVYSMPVSIFTIALITAIFPRFSRNAVQDGNELINSLKKSININIYIIVPIAVVFIYFGSELIKIFYERGMFSASDTDMTYRVLALYSISLVFYTTYLIVLKLLYSISLHKWILIISVAGALLKVLSNLLLIDEYEQNGLALSTALVYIFLYAGALVIAGNSLGRNLNFYAAKQIIYNLFNAAAALLIIILLHDSLNLSEMLYFFTAVPLFFLIYILNSALTGSGDYLSAKNLFFSYREKYFKKS